MTEPRTKMLIDTLQREKDREREMQRGEKESEREKERKRSAIAIVIAIEIVVEIAKYYEKMRCTRKGYPVFYYTKWVTYRDTAYL